MNKKAFVNDQVQANELLNARTSGLTFNRLLKKSAPLIIVRLLLIALCAYVYFNESQHSTFALLAAGVLVGALAQDFGWYARTANAWLFTQKVTDWEKVEQLAATDQRNSDEQ